MELGFGFPLTNISPKYNEIYLYNTDFSGVHWSHDA